MKLLGMRLVWEQQVLEALSTLLHAGPDLLCVATRFVVCFSLFFFFHEKGWMLGVLWVLKGRKYRGRTSLVQWTSPPVWQGTTTIGNRSEQRHADIAIN
jgi:hypothetical protein